MKYMLQTLIATLSLLISPVVLAHDHTSTTGFIAGLLHPLTGIEHLLVLMLAGLFIGCRLGSRWLAISGLSLALAAGAAAALLLGEQAWIEAAALLLLPATFAVQWLKHRCIVNLAFVSMGWLLFAHGWYHAVELAAMDTGFVIGLLMMSAAIVFLFSLIVSSVITKPAPARHAHR